LTVVVIGRRTAVSSGAATSPVEAPAIRAPSLVGAVEHKERA
jgi:hypothetical protein